MKHHTHSHARRTATPVAVLLGMVVLLAPTRAGAARTAGQATGTSSVTSGTWAATAASTSFVFTAGSGELDTAVTNTGTLALRSVAYTATASGPPGGQASFVVLACRSPWRGRTCTGGGARVLRVGARRPTATGTSTVVPVPGASTYLQIRPRQVGAPTTVTLATAVVAPADVRASIVTNQ